MYGSGSWSGYRAGRANVSFSGVEGGDLVDSVYFGGITDGANFFDDTDGFQGIFGLAFKDLCEDYSSSQCRERTDVDETQESFPVLDAFYNNGVLETKTFAVSYTGDDLVLVIDGYDSSLIDGNITYVTIQKTLSDYYGYLLVKMTDVGLNGVSLGFGGTELYESAVGGTLVDSGTTLTYLPPKAYKEIENRFNLDYGMSETFFNWGSCLTSDEIEILPQLSVTLEDDFLLVFQPEEYLLHYEDCYYWSFSAAALPILGNVIMQEKVVIFDKENKLIGFAESVGKDDLADVIFLEEANNNIIMNFSTSSSFYLGFLIVGGLFVGFFVLSKRKSQYQQI